MGVITFAEVLIHGGRTLKDNVQRPDNWDWSPERLTTIQLVSAFRKVTEDHETVTLARVNVMGRAEPGATYVVGRDKLSEAYIAMGGGRYGVPIDGELSAVIANQSMVLTDGEQSFDFGVGEGVAIVKGDSGHGGKFTIYQPHQFILVG